MPDQILALLAVRSLLAARILCQMSMRTSTDHERNRGVPIRNIIPSCVPFSMSAGNSPNLLKKPVSSMIPGIKMSTIIRMMATNWIISVKITPESPAMAV